MRFQRSLFFASLLLFSPLCADDVAGEPPTSIKKDSAVLIPHVKGIAIYIDSQPPAKQQDICGVVIDGEPFPGKKRELERRIRKKFIKNCFTKNDLIDLKKEIISYYRRHDHPLISVQIPKQLIRSGILNVIVHEAKLGSVYAVGNHHFKSDRLEGYIRAKQDEPIDVGQITQDLNWMNRNTFRQTDVVFKQGEKPGYTDIELITVDRWAYRFYAGVDNTGIRNTGQQRYYEGINIGNLFNCDQMLSYQFTSGPNFSEFMSHTLDYTVPLPWRHVLQLFGGYSSVKAEHLTIPMNSGYSTHGQSMQVSLRYDIPLPFFRDFLQEISVGGDWKRTNVNLFFGEEVFFRNSANITQLFLGYSAGYEGENWKLSFTMENFGSPARWIGQQKNSNFNALRLFAKNRYYYTRLTLTPTYHELFTGLFFHLILRGQIATTNLLSSEQMGIGGYNTVRGYIERLLNADTGLISNFEIRSPFFHLWTINKKRNIVDNLQFLAFFDYGLQLLHQVPAGLKKREYLASYGVGARYQIGPWVAARIDYGEQIHHISEDPKHHKWHFGLIASY